MLFIFRWLGRLGGARIRIGITRAFVAVGATTTGLVLPPRRQQHFSDSRKRVVRLSLFVSARHGPTHRPINVDHSASQWTRSGCIRMFNRLIGVVMKAKSIAALLVASSASLA